MPHPSVTVFWFRRDLRLEDNAGLFHALQGGAPVLPLFIFDREILDDLEERQDRRVAFIHQALQGLDARLAEAGGRLLVRHGSPMEVWRELLRDYAILAVHAGRDYEPYAGERDRRVAALLGEHNIPFHSHKDQVIFDGDEVVKEDGQPYTVYTPYMRKWLARLTPEDLAAHPSERLFGHVAQGVEGGVPPLTEIGFKPMAVESVPEIDESIIRNYDRTRALETYGRALKGRGDQGGG